MKRFLAPLAALLVHALPGTPARAAEAPGDAGVLLKQGQRLDKEGKGELALELYRAALLLAPKNAEAHRLIAGALQRDDKCEEAVPEFRAYLDLVAAKGKAGAAYEASVVGLATCLRRTQAKLEVHPSTEARCTVDGGAPRDASPALPATFDVVPGDHEITCTKEGRYPASLTATVAAREQQRVEVELAPVPVKPPETPVIAPVADPAPLAAIGGTPAPPPPAKPAEFVLPPLEDPSNTDPAPTPPAPEKAPPPAPAAEGAPVTNPPETQAISPIPTPAPAPPPAPVPTTGELEIDAEGRGWTCRVDGGAFLAPSISGEILTDLAPGAHLVSCERSGAEPVEEHFTLEAGERKVIAAKYQPRQAPPAPPVDNEIHEPAWEPIADAVELQFAGGFGAGLGTFGFGVGARYDAWGAMIGTGIYPFALTATRYLNPGRSGFYFSGGYVRISDGLLRSAFATQDLPKGHGFWAGAGVDVRPDRHLEFRIGVGLGYNTTGLAEGPLTLDFSAAFIP